MLEDPAHCIRITYLIRVTAWRSPVIYPEKTGRNSETSEGLPQRRHPAAWQMRLLRANRKKSRNRKQHGLACIHVHWIFCHLHVHNCCSWMCLLSSYWYSTMYIHPSYQIKSNLAKSTLACQKKSAFSSSKSTDSTVYIWKTPWFIAGYRKRIARCPQPPPSAWSFRPCLGGRGKKLNPHHKATEKTHFNPLKNILIVI